LYWCPEQGVPGKIDCIDVCGGRRRTPLPNCYFEDCQVGEKLTTPGRTITEADVVMFAAFTGDWHPVHTNKEFARTSAFGERIAHGLLALVVGDALAYRLGHHGFGLLPKSTIALCGMEKVRFLRPVKIGDTLFLQAEIFQLMKTRQNSGIITLRNRIKNQHQEDVITYLLKVLAGCRQA